MGHHIKMHLPFQSKDVSRIFEFQQATSYAINSIVYILNSTSALSVPVFNFLNVVVWFRSSGIPPLSLFFYISASFLFPVSIQITLACLIRVRQWKRKWEVPLPYHHSYSRSSPPLFFLSPTHFILSAVSQADFANWCVKSRLISHGIYAFIVICLYINRCSIICILRKH